MPLPINDLSVLATYASGVMGRSDHHAQTVGGIALTLLGAILWRADDASLEAFGNSGAAGNVLWARISGKRYAFSYDHDAGEIMMKERSTHGPVLHRFSNATPVQQVQAIFAAL